MIAADIESRLSDTFELTHLEIINESHQHNVPANSQTHFKLIIVSPAFEQLSLVKRHQAVYQCLQDLMNNPIHALSMHCMTPAQWQDNPSVAASPQCLGGKAKESD